MSLKYFFSFKWLRKRNKAKKPTPDAWQSIVLKIAKLELGVHEIYGPKHNSKIIEYHDSCTGKFKSDEISWCSAFVNWVFMKADLPRTKNATAQSWKNWGKSSRKNPTVGDVVVFGKPNSWKGHVGIFIEESALKIKVLGGNQGNKVCYRWYYKSLNPKLKLLDIRTMK